MTYSVKYKNNQTICEEESCSGDKQVLCREKNCAGKPLRVYEHGNSITVCNLSFNYNLIIKYHCYEHINNLNIYNYLVAKTTPS